MNYTDNQIPLLRKYESIGIGDRKHIQNKPRPSWDAYFMPMCDEAAERSLDANTNFGCLFVRNNRIIVTSYNSFPPDCPDNIMPNSRGDDNSPVKLKFMNHAEMAGILFAASEGISLNGCTLYCQGHPCSSCSRALITCGVKNWIIGNKSYQADSEEKLLREFWVEVGKVNIKYYKEELRGDCP